MHRWIPASLALILSVAGVSAQDIPAQNEAGVTLGYIVRRATSAITVDGKLTPAEWQHAVKVAGFRVSGREQLAAEQTVMHLLYDDTNLYLGVKCVESNMPSLVADIRVHDGRVWHDDCVEFFIDASHDHSTYQQFIVNSAATRYDAFKFDSTWTVQWRAATSKSDRAWYLEVALPFASLGAGTPRPGAVWGFNLDRERRAGGGTQLYNWADVKGVFHSPTLFGHLCFVDKAWRGTEAEMRPLARGIQGDEARLYIDGGYWAFPTEGTPRKWSYRDLLTTQHEAVKTYWDDLDRIYKARPDMVRRKDFEAYRKRYTEIVRLAKSAGPVDPEACAAGKVFLDTLRTSLKDLYWTVRIELLNESF